MVMDAMRMNQGYVGECLVIDEEPNAYAANFFIYQKTPTNHYGMSAQIIASKLSVVAQVFTIKLDHGLSKFSCDIIVKWARSISLERNG